LPENVIDKKISLQLFTADLETFLFETKKCFRKKCFGFSKQKFPKQKNVSNFFVSKTAYIIFRINATLKK